MTILEYENTIAGYRTENERLRREIKDLKEEKEEMEYLNERDNILQLHEAGYFD